MTRPAFSRIAAAVVLAVAIGCADDGKKSSSDTTVTPTDDGANGAPGRGPGRGGPGRPTGDGSAVTVETGDFKAVEKALAAAKGKVVLVDVWATWCQPCVASFPKLVAKYNTYAGQGLAVLSVSVDKPEQSAAVREFLQEHNAAFANVHLLRDTPARKALGDKGLADKFGYAGSIPHAALFDRGGNRVWAGHPSDPALKSLIESELAKSADDVASAPPATAPTSPGAPGEIAVRAVRFDGVEKAIAAAKGKVVLIDCWATWCGPCVASFPKLVEKHEKYNAKGLAVISVSLDAPNKGAEVLAFLKKNRAAFTNLHLTMDPAAEQALVNRFAYEGGIPHAVLFDKAGKRVWAGHPMDPGLESKIQAELGKSDDAAAAPPAPGSGEVAVKQVKFDGVESALADAKGKVVLIDCWATWCGPCVASFPKLVEKHEKYNAKGLAVISLSTDKAADAPKVIDFLKKNNAAFLNLHMPLDAAAAKSLQEKFAYKNAIPHAVLFDKAGKRVWAGHPMDPKLTPIIEAELAK